MTLTHIDKAGDSRGKPTLNASDGLNQGSIKSHATEAIAYRSEDAIEAARVVQKDDQIIVFDGVANKGLFGRDGSGNYVVKIAEDGTDVLTATDDQLIFNSAQNIFKIVDTIPISISHVHTANSARTTSQAHGQVGRPIAISFANNLVAPGVLGSPSYQMPFTYPATSGGVLVISTLLQMYVDGTDVTVYTWSTNATTITADIKCYILQETAS